LSFLGENRAEHDEKEANEKPSWWGGATSEKRDIVGVLRGEYLCALPDFNDVGMGTPGQQVHKIRRGRKEQSKKNGCRLTTDSTPKFTLHP